MGYGFENEIAKDQRKDSDMSTNGNQLNAAFVEDEGFKVPIMTVPLRGSIEPEIERLKERVLHQLTREKPEPVFRVPLQRAVGDAAALAWLTPYPLLVLPLLAQEKAEIAIKRVKRQHEIRRKSGLFVSAAA